MPTATGLYYKNYGKAFLYHCNIAMDPGLIFLVIYCTSIYSITL